MGVDLGGTKIEAVALDGRGAERARVRVATPPAYEACLDAIAALVAHVETLVGGVGSVGVGMPGTLSPLSGLVKNANSTWLNERPFGRDLSERLGREVRCTNDANCFALSEAVDGAASGARTVFGVILGTGVGGGIVVGHVPLEGAQRIAGEWGHNPLPWPGADECPGPACWCGRSGCLETFLSGPGLTADHELHEGERTGAEQLGARVAGGDAAATRTFERYADRLARGLATVVNIVDPEVIVLGGGLSNLPGLAAAASTRLPRYVFTDTVTTRVVRNVHGDSSGVRGAAWLWPLEPSGARDA